MKVDFDEERWFQVEVVLVEGEHKLEFKFSENPLTVSLNERGRILAAVQTAISAMLAYKNT